jgi:hypothetical protein
LSVNKDGEYDDRELILSRLNIVIDYMQSKAVNGRVSKEDKLRLEWFKAFVYSCNVFSQIKRDVDVELLAKKYELLVEEIRMLREAKKV